MRAVRAVLVVWFLLLATLPLAWLALTSVKTYQDTVSAHAKFVPWSGPFAPDPRAEDSVRFAATLDAYRNLAKPVAGTPNDFYHYLGNSIIIGVLSTLAAVCLGTICA